MRCRAFVRNRTDPHSPQEVLAERLLDDVRPEVTGANLLERVLGDGALVDPAFYAFRVVDDGVRLHRIQRARRRCTPARLGLTPRD